MLIRDFVQVDAPLALVRARLLEPVPGWLADGASVAYADAERIFRTVSPNDGGLMVATRVQVELGAPFVRGEGLVVPMNWWASGAPELFPVLDADLEIMPLGPGQVTLTLMGRYEPPLGQAGRALDRQALHRIAEACVRSFLHRTADHLL
jgi:hypothetical protein